MRIHPAMFAAGFFVAIIGKLPAQSLSASLGWGTFVERITPVYNTITLENPPQAVAEVDFEAVTPGDTVRTIARDVTRQDGFTAQYDVGLLHPGAEARAICFDAAHLPIDTITQSIAVIAAPAWLRASTVSGVAVAGDSMLFTARYPIGPVPSSTAGATAIGDRIGALAIDSAAVELYIAYNYRLRTAVARSVMESFDLDLFGRARRGTTSRLQSLTVALDSTMNLSLSGYAGVATWPYLFDYEGISLATRVYPPIRVDVGTLASDRISMSARIARHGSTSGYLHDGSGITSITSATYGIGSERGLLQTQLSGVPTSGSLVVEAISGASVRYVEFPAARVDTAYGGRIMIHGAVQAEPLWQFPSTRVDGSFLMDRTFGPVSFPMVPVSAFILDSAYLLPRDWPQPAMATQGNRCGAVWVETSPEQGKLLLSTLDTARAQLSPAVQIIANDNSIGSPALAMGTDGSAVIAWTQNRHHASESLADATAGQLSASQDIWYAWYDAETRSVLAAGSMPDDSSGITAGRRDGAPSVCRLADDEYMVVWSGPLPGSEGTTIWFSRVMRSGNDVTALVPQSVSFVPGTLLHMRLLPRSNGGATLVAVVNTDLTKNADPQVKMWQWNGTTWTEDVFPGIEGVAFSEVAGASDGDPALVAAIGRQFDEHGSYRPLLVLQSSTGAGQPTISATFALDSASDIGRLTVNVKGGLAVASFQLYAKTDVSTGNEGHRIFFVRDLTSPASFWTRIDAPADFCDTTAFVWAAASGLVRDGEYYLLTQEFNENGVTAAPADGVRFGEKRLGLVLHRARISPIDLTPIPPDVSAVPSAGAAVLTAVDALTVIPNPTREASRLLFSVTRVGRVRVELFDVRGARVAGVTDAVLSAGPHDIDLPTSGLASGAYIVRVDQGGSVRSQTVMVMHDGR